VPEHQPGFEHVDSCVGQPLPAGVECWQEQQWCWLAVAAAAAVALASSPTAHMPREVTQRPAATSNMYIVNEVVNVRLCMPKSAANACMDCRILLSAASVNQARTHRAKVLPGCVLLSQTAAAAGSMTGSSSPGESTTAQHRWCYCCYCCCCWCSAQQRHPQA